MKIRIKRWVLVDKQRIIKLEEELKKAKETTRIHKDYIDELLEDLSNKKEKIEKLEKEVKKQHEGFMASVEEKCEIAKELDQLKEKSKAEKKELKDKIKELEKQLEDSMSNKYIVRKVRATKSKSQTMNIKRSTRQSNAIKMVKEKL